MSRKCSFYTPIDNSVSNINMLDPYFITLCHSHYDTSASATIKGLVDLIRVYIQYLDAIVHHLSVTVFHIRGKDKVEFVNPLYWSGERPDVRVVSISCVQLDVVENHDGGHMVVGYFVAESYKEGHLYNVVCTDRKVGAKLSILGLEVSIVLLTTDNMLSQILYLGLNSSDLFLQFYAELLFLEKKLVKE